MTHVDTIRNSRKLPSGEGHELILRELQKILASPQFCNSRRYPALLQYVVKHTLAGQTDRLKERTLGIEVFDRPASYDTNADTVVRYTASEVRKRLSLYYHGLEGKPEVHISLPAGSYIPEFLMAEDGSCITAEHHAVTGEQDLEVYEAKPVALTSNVIFPPMDSKTISPAVLTDRTVPANKSHWKWWASAAVFTTLCLLGGWTFVTRRAAAREPFEEFWRPMLHDQHSLLVCSGGSVVKKGSLLGWATADRDTEYPFVSEQMAYAITGISSLAERRNVSINLLFSASTPLTDLRNRPVVLLGGYNNQWTMRLLKPLPFHFGDDLPDSIVTTADPSRRYQRDTSRPYSNTDDYALVARFHNAATDSWVVVIAGLGRNGTEAAAQFATSPVYLKQLRERIGDSFALHNIEAVLKMSVIDGKTGAPVILDAREW